MQKTKTKCQDLEVNFSRTSPHHADLQIGSGKLEYVDQAKILGLWLQNDLKWQTQVDVMLKKGNKRLFILRSLKRFDVDREELTVVYLRPVIEYADVVWHSGLTQKQAGDLERIQRRACRISLHNGHQFTTYTESIKQCNLDRLSERKVDHRLKLARGLVDNPGTSHLLPPIRISTHGKNLRNANHFSQPKIKTNRFKQSPIPYFVSLLNKQ